MESKTVVIGAGHKARHGKDTFCENLVEAYKDKYDIRKYTFGQALKEEVNALGNQYQYCIEHGIVIDHEPDMTDPLCQTEYGKQPALLQYWGMLRRKQNPMYWVKQVRNKIKEDNPAFALIADVRFPNEFLFINHCKGFTVKVSRIGYVDLTRDPNHVSEIALDGFEFDYDIRVGEGDLAGLKTDSLYVMEDIIARVTPKIPDFSTMEQEAEECSLQLPLFA